MEFKKGDGWKAGYDPETGRYAAERGGCGSYHLYEITKEIYDALSDGMSDWDVCHLMDGARELYMDVNDRCGPPYTVIFDDDYATLCPWASAPQSGRVWPDALTDAAVELFASQENNREQRRKKREKKET